MAEKLKISRREKLGMAIQTVGVLIVIVGVLVEVQLGADAGFVCITAGSLGFAIGTKLKGR